MHRYINILSSWQIAYMSNLGVLLVHLWVDVYDKNNKPEDFLSQTYRNQSLIFFANSNPMNRLEQLKLILREGVAP